MEMYALNLHDSSSFSVTLDGYYYKLVHAVHREDYGEEGAKNIVRNVVNIFKKNQEQLVDSTKNNNTLLVGKVQSGKTANLEMYTALAFDHGYNVLVIYGGYDKSLLDQTTKRFTKTFGANDVDSNVPVIFTTDDSAQLSDIDDYAIEEYFEENKPIIFVSMKRPIAMEKINTVLSQLDKTKFKAFVIDDEGDQASLNTAKDKIADSSATYNEILKMKEVLNNPMYLSVTATPHANIFLNEWSALRPDSICLIHPGSGYNGAATYHLDENEIIQIVSDKEQEELTAGEMPASLWDAIRYFIVASAIKYKRVANRKKRDSDMIIHAFREVIHHSRMYTAIDFFIKAMQDSFKYNDECMVAYLAELKTSYEKYASEEIKQSYPFESLTDGIIDVIRKTKVVLKNARGKDTQGKNKIKTHLIYIGGDLLQRGLTFPNLITTYFTRWASGGGNMDTNLQRARWFGYRGKYIDLCKIFTTETIAQEFTRLAEIEEDLWEQFAEVEEGELNIDDILIRADDTKQRPTSKQRVDYKPVTFKNRWIKQKTLLCESGDIQNSNGQLDSMFNLESWKTTTAGSTNESVTARYTYFNASKFAKLVKVMCGIFNEEQKKAILDLSGNSDIPIILMGHDETSRYRSVYEEQFKIKALHQGANSTIKELITYLGDSHVIIDKNKINVQVHRIVPGTDKKYPMYKKEQYVFAIYIPAQKEKRYFVKEEYHA